uniref:non-specific serine/threonine protein kinase n=1 Tax=Meloidogyne enterolobii TaxID=390850 RepID=A0A6V7XIQ7_MELEN|nr:unnamed protein product [Meloidogyne enterolobii]
MARMTQKQTTTDEEAKQIQNLHIESKTEGKRSSPSGRLNAEKVGIALESILKIKDNKLPSSTTEDDIENDSFLLRRRGSSSDDNNKRKTKTTTDGGLEGSSHHLPHHNYSEHHTDRLNTNLVVVGQQGPALPPSMKKVFLEENEMNKITTNTMSDQTRTITSRTPKDFFFINVLGEGSFSTVYYSKEVHTGDEYAIKVLLKSEIRREGRARYVLREKDIMALLTYFYGGHPFIIRLYCTFQDNERLYFALAYAKHGELLDWLRRLGSFDEEATLFYASEILCALEFLHKCKIIHRDLKPENILVGKDWHIMLSDFGTSKIINSEQTNKEQLPQQILDDVTTTLPHHQLLPPTKIVEVSEVLLSVQHII